MSASDVLVSVCMGQARLHRPGCGARPLRTRGGVSWRSWAASPPTWASRRPSLSPCTSAGLSYTVSFSAALLVVGVCVPSTTWYHNHMLYIYNNCSISFQWSITFSNFQSLYCIALLYNCIRRMLVCLKSFVHLRFIVHLCVYRVPTSEYCPPRLVVLKAWLQFSVLDYVASGPGSLG